MQKQVKLNEEQLKKIIREAVHNQLVMNEEEVLNEFGIPQSVKDAYGSAKTGAKNYWNKLRGKFRKNNDSEYGQEGNDENITYIDPDDDYQPYNWDNDNDPSHIDINPSEGEQEGNDPFSGLNFDVEETPNTSEINPDEPQQQATYGEPFQYGLDASRAAHDQNQQEQGGQTQFGGQNQFINPQQNEEPAQQQNTSQEGQQPQEAQQQPQAPQPDPYKRGGKYMLSFNQENEDVFNNYITPAYNSLTSVMKSLQNLESLGQQKYNETSKIWNDYGGSNMQGAQSNYKTVSQQINSIMPTLNDIKQQMKGILYANGVRQSEDYQHFNMEEQRIRKIISKSINKVLKESLIRK